MFGLGKKNKSKAKANAVSPDLAKANLATKLNKKAESGISPEIVSVTVAGSGLGRITANKKFIWTDSDGVQKGIVMVLSTNDEPSAKGVRVFGSINDRKDKVKGSILKLMESDNENSAIHLASTTELLSHNFIGIIPDKVTVATMRNYDILREITYFLATVDISSEAQNAIELDIEPLVLDVLKDESNPEGFVEVTLSDLNTIQTTNGMTITKFINEKCGISPVTTNEVTSTEQSTEPDSSDAQSLPPTVADKPVPTLNDEPEPILDDDLDDELVNDTDYESVEDGDIGLLTDDDEFESDVDIEYGEDGDLDDIEYDDPDEIVYSSEDVQQSLNKLVKRDDLEFRLNSGPIEEFFESRNSEPLQIDLGSLSDQSKWLRQQAEPILNAANTKLNKINQEHLSHLRALATDKQYQFINALREELSLTSPTSKYAEVLSKLDEDQNNNLELIDEGHENRIQSIRDDFERVAELEAKRAAEEAKARYYDRNSGEMELKIDKAVHELRKNVIGSVNSKRNRVLSAREEFAHAQFDRAALSITKALVDLDTEFKTQELQVYEQSMKQISKLLVENRDIDTKRTDALRRELDTSEKVRALETEIAETKARADKELLERDAKFESMVKNLTNKWVRERTEIEAELEAKANRYAEDLRQTRNEYDSLRNHHAEDIKLAVDAARDKAKIHFDQTVSGLNAQIQVLESSTKRSTYVMVAYMVAIALSFLAIGVLVGVTWPHMAQANPSALGLDFQQLTAVTESLIM